MTTPTRWGPTLSQRSPTQEFFLRYRWMLVTASALIVIVGLAVIFNLGGGRAVEEETIRVHAASSLRDVMLDFKSDFELANPEATIEVNFGGSNAIVTQLREGAPGDVLATADERTMGRAIEAGLVAGEPTIIARNRLEVAVPADNPAGIDSLADLADANAVVAFCAVEVPCGSATAMLLERAGMTVEADTSEPNVRSVLAKVASGEVDAGIVFHTDVVSAEGSVIGVPIDNDVNVTTQTLVARLVDATPLTGRLLQFTTSLQAAIFLTSAGFDLP